MKFHRTDVLFLAGTLSMLGIIATGSEDVVFGVHVCAQIVFLVLLVGHALAAGFFPVDLQADASSRVGKVCGIVLPQLLFLAGVVPIQHNPKLAERTHAGEALAYLAELNSAQARYILRHGRYSTVPASFDVLLPETLKRFTIGAISIVEDPNPRSPKHAWRATLVRKGRSTYGAYTITATYDSQGLSYSCSSGEGDCNELLP